MTAARALLVAALPAIVASCGGSGEVRTEEPAPVEAPCTVDADCATDDVCLQARCDARSGACTLEPAPPRCDVFECGVDPCGHDCGGCEDPAFCYRGTCAWPCGDLTLEGCCGEDGEWRFCFDDRTVVARCVNGCGWNPTSRIYDCGYEGEEPTGEHPMACPPLPGASGTSDDYSRPSRAASRPQ